MRAKRGGRLLYGVATSDLKYGFRKMKVKALSHISRSDRSRVTACGIKIPAGQAWDWYVFMPSFVEATVSCGRCKKRWEDELSKRYIYCVEEEGMVEVGSQTPPCNHGVNPPPKRLKP